MDRKNDKDTTGRQSERLGSEKCGHRLFPDFPECTFKWHRHHEEIGIQDVVELEASLQSGGLLKPNVSAHQRAKRRMVPPVVRRSSVVPFRFILLPPDHVTHAYRACDSDKLDFDSSRSG